LQIPTGYNCEFGIYDSYSKYLHVHNNNIFNNTDHGLKAVIHENEDKEIVNASNNWWGDISGPYHPDTNSGGSGNNVSDDVTFDDWRIDDFHFSNDITGQIIIPEIYNNTANTFNIQLFNYGFAIDNVSVILVIDDNVIIFNESINFLEDEFIDLPVVWKPNRIGVHAISMIIDDMNQIVEENEYNNGHSLSITVRNESKLIVSINSKHIEILPNSSTHLFVNITNKNIGNESVFFALATPGNWKYNLNHIVALIESNSTLQLRIDVTSPQDATYRNIEQFSLAIILSSDPSISESITFSIGIQRHRNISIAIEHEEYLDKNQSSIVVISALNNGNSAEIIRIQNISIPNGWEIVSDDLTFSVQSFQRRVFSFIIRASDQSISGIYPINFAVNYLSIEFISYPFNVTLLPTYTLNISGDTIKEGSIGELVTFELFLKNDGNSITTITIFGIDVEISSDQFQMLPFQDSSVLISFRVPTNQYPSDVVAKYISIYSGVTTHSIIQLSIVVSETRNLNVQLLYFSSFSINQVNNGELTIANNGNVIEDFNLSFDVSNHYSLRFVAPLFGTLLPFSNITIPIIITIPLDIGLLSTKQELIVHVSDEVSKILTFKISDSYWNISIDESINHTNNGNQYIIDLIVVNSGTGDVEFTLFSNNSSDWEVIVFPEQSVVKANSQYRFQIEIIKSTAYPKSGQIHLFNTQHNVSIFFDTPPIISLQQPSNIYPNSPISLSVISENCVNVEWSIGNEIATGFSINHTFSLSGEQDIIIFGTNSNGFTTQVVVSVVVTDYNPHASFAYKLDQGTIYLFANSSEDIGGEIDQYRWEIEGVHYIGKVISFTPSSLGKYSIELTVVDDNGNENSTLEIIEVKKQDLIELASETDNNPIPFFVIIFILLGVCTLLLSREMNKGNDVISSKEGITKLSMQQHDQLEEGIEIIDEDQIQSIIHDSDFQPPKVDNNISKTSVEEMDNDSISQSGK